MGPGLRLVHRFGLSTFGARIWMVLSHVSSHGSDTSLDSPALSKIRAKQNRKANLLGFLTDATPSYALVNFLAQCKCSEIDSVTTLSDSPTSSILF